MVIQTHLEVGVPKAAAVWFIFIKACVFGNLDFMPTKIVQQLLKIYNSIKPSCHELNSHAWFELELSFPETKALPFPYGFKLSVFRCFIRSARKHNLSPRTLS